MPINAVKRKVRIFLAWVLQLHDTPESIAWGTAIGLLIAFSPTFGLQMVLCLLLSLAVRMNRLMALALVQITNFVTALPIYYACYRVGCVMMWQSALGYGRFQEQFRAMRSAEGTFREHVNLVLGGVWLIAREVALPMVVGGLAVGVLTAVPGWYLTRWFVVHHRAKLAEKKGMVSGDDDAGEAVQDRRGSETD